MNKGVKWMLAISEWLYRVFLHTYPIPFQRTFGSRMAQTFRDSCRATLQHHGPRGLISLWLHTLCDLAITVPLERWHVLQEKIHVMTTYGAAQKFPTRLWIALAMTFIAFVVSLIASLNFYLIEDSSRLTQAAYSASPLLRFSYDGIYLTALAAGVAICTIIGYAIVQRDTLVVGGVIIVALLVAFGGFGGLMVRHPLTFIIFLVAFLALILLCLLPGRLVATRARGSLGTRARMMLGACVSASTLLLINVGALVLHTLLLNPVSHALYMEGQVAGTPWNFSLIAMGIALLTMLGCLASLGFALRLPTRQA